MDEKGGFVVEQVVLGDLDCALNLEGEKLLNHRVGNVMWRSPEGQARRGIGKFSEVFSYGFLVGRPICHRDEVAKNQLTVSLYNH